MLSSKLLHLEFVGHHLLQLLLLLGLDGLERSLLFLRWREIMYSLRVTAGEGRHWDGEVSGERVRGNGAK
jgi:hypothetical protein